MAAEPRIYTRYSAKLHRSKCAKANCDFMQILVAFLRPTQTTHGSNTTTHEQASTWKWQFYTDINAGLRVPECRHGESLVCKTCNIVRTENDYAVHTYAHVSHSSGAKSQVALGPVSDRTGLVLAI